MTPTKEENFVRVNKKLITNLLDHATATVGLVEAATSEYRETGTLPIGSLMYVVQSLDLIVTNLGILGGVLDQDDLPF